MQVKFHILSTTNTRIFCSSLIFFRKIFLLLFQENINYAWNFIINSVQAGKVQVDLIFNVSLCSPRKYISYRGICNGYKRGIQFLSKKNPTLSLLFLLTIRFPTFLLTRKHFFFFAPKPGHRSESIN